MARSQTRQSREKSLRYTICSAHGDIISDVQLTFSTATKLTFAEREAFTVMMDGGRLCEPKEDFAIAIVECLDNHKAAWAPPTAITRPAPAAAELR